MAKVLFVGGLILLGVLVFSLPKLLHGFPATILAPVVMMVVGAFMLGLKNRP